jgi:hypothetical protein
MRTAEPRKRASAICVFAGLGYKPLTSVSPTQPLDGCRRQWSRQAADDRLPIAPCRGRQVCWRDPLSYRGRLLPNDCCPEVSRGRLGFKTHASRRRTTHQNLPAVRR